MSFPRLIISGLAGGTGKTFVSLGLTRAFQRQGLNVRAYKKGPDYIDTAWLALAARGSASNLDPFMLSPDGLRTLFAQGACGADISIIEGNRGIFDGRDLSGSTSTAELAKDLNAPIILVVDCTKVTRTVAALVAGCRAFPGGERIAGVILNRAARSRHESITRRAIEELAGVPVFGALPRLRHIPIFERREGLVTIQNHEDAQRALDTLARLLEENADLPALRQLAVSAPDFPAYTEQPLLPAAPVSSARPRIGVVQDAVLWQYYDENLEALRRAGAELIPLSLLRRQLASTPAETPGLWPDIDGLYLGGGDLAPYATILADDQERRGEVAALVRSGLPVYAEGAGFLYLLASYTTHETYPMAGIFPYRTVRHRAPQGLGYVEAVAAGEARYLPSGTTVRGHEFRFESLEDVPPGAGLLERNPDIGIAPVQDGFLYENVFGSLMQIFAPAVPGWAERLVSAASRK